MKEKEDGHYQQGGVGDEAVVGAGCEEGFECFQGVVDDVIRRTFGDATPGGDLVIVEVFEKFELEEFFFAIGEPAKRLGEFFGQGFVGL